VRTQKPGAAAIHTQAGRHDEPFGTFRQKRKCDDRNHAQPDHDGHHRGVRCDGDVTIVTEIGADLLPKACGTGDGCAASCASSCASAV
jgi:hypothetical protein